MKILNAQQIREVDTYTISHEPIRSIELMERAALCCVRRLVKLVDLDDKIYILCGKGNNGGDGLAMARILREREYDIEVIVLHNKNEFSSDAGINYDLFKNKFPAQLKDVENSEHAKTHLSHHHAILVDCIFGSGLNKEISGYISEVISYINNNFSRIISIDVPSGLFIDKPSIENSSIIHSTLTLSLQLPKLAFLLPENKQFVPEFELVNIGLSETGIQLQHTNNHYLVLNEIRTLLKSRNKFDHKGTYGHGLLMAGSKGKAGAAVIAAKACMRSGVGMLTVHSCQEVINGVLMHLPEAMSSTDREQAFITECIDPEKYDAIAFGPGAGTHEDTQTALKKLLQYYKGRLVIDADGLNILSENKTWLDYLPAHSILTPHPGEFERLAGKSADDFERLEKARSFSRRYNIILILKGAHTLIALPDGNVFFNSSGNPGLAKAGSGDGLTGILLGLLCRGYSPAQASFIGVFVHGFSADLLLKKNSSESLLISDVIDTLPKAFRKMYEPKED